MLDTIWPLVRFLHVGAAILWVGGQLTLSLIMRPAASSTLGNTDRATLFTEVGSRFGRISTVVLMPMLLASGVALAWHRGVDVGTLAQPGYGVTLGAKIVLVLASFVLAAVHGVLAVRGGARAARAAGVSGLAVSLVVVYLSTALVL